MMKGSDCTSILRSRVDNLSAHPGLLLSPANRPGIARRCSSRGVDSQNLRCAAASASLTAVPEVSICIQDTRWSPRGHPGAAQSDHLSSSHPVHCISALSFAAGALALAVASVKQFCQGNHKLHCIQYTDFICRERLLQRQCRHSHVFGAAGWGRQRHAGAAPSNH